MSSKKYDNAECYERNIIHDIVFLEDGIEFEYDGGGDDLNGYVLLIIDKIRKKESQQEHQYLFLDDFFERRPFHVFLSQLSTISQQ
ncbi:hypothetical protein ACOSQ4_017328 [Xanthoceras sorbifolium]